MGYRETIIEQEIGSRKSEARCQKPDFRHILPRFKYNGPALNGTICIFKIELCSTERGLFHEPGCFFYGFPKRVGSVRILDILLSQVQRNDWQQL